VALFSHILSFTDGLGRETNSVRCVWRNGSRDSAYASLATRTAYPFGTDNHVVTTDPLDVQTVTRTYYEGNAAITEAVSAGVTNRTIRVQGGAVVDEKYWDGKWTRETRSTAYDAACRSVETVTAEASDCPVFAKSVTTYDFLGREVSVAAPLGVTSNFYDGASDRVLRVTRTGSPDTIYVYDALGNVTATALDVDADGQVSYAGTDRISSAATRYEKDASNVWWRVSAQATACGGVTNVSSITREQLTGLSDALRSRAVMTARNGAVTTVATSFDPATSVVTETALADTTTPAVRRTLFGCELERSGADEATLSGYDGFARVVSQTVTNGIGTVSTLAVVYDTLGNAVTNTATYGNLAAVSAVAYDAQGRAVSQTDALGNAVDTAYDSLGQALSLSGATYPVTYAYDTAGRKVALSTTRDGVTPDTTHWLNDGATGLLTNKVCADGSHVSYTYTTSGRPARTTWARGAFKENSWDWFGQSTGTAYSDGTPPAFNAYTAAGFLAVSSNAVARYIYQSADSGVATNTAVLIGTNAFAIGKTLDPFQRLSVLCTGDAQSPVRYGYSDGDAMSSVSNAAFGVAYRFDGTRDAGCTVTLTNGRTVTRAVIRDPHRRHLVTGVSNVIGGSVYSSTACGHDLLGNVTNRNGDAFSYNPRSEVSDAVVGTNVFDYAYDGIGNNAVVTVNAVAATYTANCLNQYTAVTGGMAVTTSYDADGNLIGLGPLSLTWDAENRNTAILSNDVAFIANGYDPQHRRVVKTMPSETRSFLYDGWLPVFENISRSDGTSEVREHVWGKDLSGTRGGAGGVGGLLATRIGNAWYFPLYDANGNITDYVSESGAPVAHREYGPYGETTVATGPMVNYFNFWFSSKYLDHETGLYYYGLRFYSPALTRFINRDPIEEEGGLNLYSICENNLINRFDSTGETWTTNWEFFWDWVLERGEENRIYGTGTVELEEMKSSPGAKQMRNAYKAGGCKTIKNNSFGTVKAYFTTTWLPNKTAFQVGGFLYDAVNNGDGTVTYSIRNQASAYSFFLHIPGVPHKPRGGTIRLFGNINQTFMFTEKSPCCDKKKESK